MLALMREMSGSSVCLVCLSACILCAHHIIQHFSLSSTTCTQVFGGYCEGADVIIVLVFPIEEEEEKKVRLPEMQLPFPS